MEVQDQIVNEALTVLPELARALLASKPHRHYPWRGPDMLPRAGEGQPGGPGCPADEAPDEAGQGPLHWHTPADIPVAQIKLMAHLAIHGPKTMSEMAEGLEVTTPAITGLVDKLEKRGLVERVRDSQDRRVVRVQLGPRARMYIEQYLAERRRQMRLVLATLAPDEQRTFVKTLKLMAEVLHAKSAAEEVE